VLEIKAIYYHKFIHWLQVMRLKGDLNDLASVYTENIHLKLTDGIMSHCLRPCDCSVLCVLLQHESSPFMHSFIYLFVCLFVCLLAYLLACLIFLKKPVNRGKKCNAKCLK
jgi:hypothetical protein